jgi:hypothetical protein
MRTLAFAILIALTSAGLASAQMGNPLAGHFDSNPLSGHFGSCAHNNSKHCQEAREAFAEHHNGMSPEQWDNQSYQGHKGRWTKGEKGWQWEGSNGEQYRKVHDKWGWVDQHTHHHDHND